MNWNLIICSANVGRSFGGKHYLVAKALVLIPATGEGLTVGIVANAAHGKAMRQTSVLLNH
jgi:hypothetical protein